MQTQWPQCPFLTKNEVWGVWKPGQQGQREAKAFSPPFQSSWQEKDEVKISATSALGHMLCRLKKCKPGSPLRKEVNSFLVPLLLSLQDNNTDVVKVLVSSVLTTCLLYTSDAADECVNV